MQAQEHNTHTLEHSENNHKEGKHIVAASIGYTYIPKGASLHGHDNDKGFFVPTIGLDYFYEVAHKWEIGLMLDFELDHYVITSKDLERENALLVIGVGSYEFARGWHVLGGGGIELEKNENVAVIRLGVEKKFELPNHWSIGPSFLWDLKKDYDTWSINFLVSKRL